MSPQIGGSHLHDNIISVNWSTGRIDIEGECAGRAEQCRTVRTHIGDRDGARNHNICGHQYEKFHVVPALNLRKTQSLWIAVKGDLNQVATTVSHRHKIVTLPAMAQNSILVWAAGG